MSFQTRIVFKYGRYTAFMRIKVIKSLKKGRFRIYFDAENISKNKNTAVKPNNFNVKLYA